MKKPTLQQVPFASGLGWRETGFLYQEKNDGVHTFYTLENGSVLNCERMRDGRLIANDIVIRETTRMRWDILRLLSLPPGMELCRTGYGGEFLREVVRAGGEGIVAKPLDLGFGIGWLKCKRAEVFQCRVAALDPFKGSVSLTRWPDGEPMGSLALHSAFDDVRLGSILKVEAFGRHPKSGLLREARLETVLQF